MGHYKNLNYDDHLQAENAYLQMKIVLERGVTFMDLERGDRALPTDIENLFLRNIIAYEGRYDDSKTFSLLKKIERPGAFSVANKVLDSEIEAAWNNLSSLLCRLRKQLDPRSF